MLRNALMVSWSVLFCALVAQPARLAAQPTSVPLLRGLNPAMISATPFSKGDFVLSWNNDTITCNGEAVSAVEWIAPHPQLIAKKLLNFPVTIGFSVDETGRAVDMRVLEGGYVEGELEASFDTEATTMRIDTKRFLARFAVRDLMPSLRASRFVEGARRSECRVVYSPQYVETARVPRDTLAILGVVPRMSLNTALRDQLGGGDCSTVGWPAPLFRGFPDFRKVSAREGARKWSWVRFDIDGNGAPANVSVIFSSGDADLDAQSLLAFRDNRFAGGPRTGCVAAWWRNPGVIPAPPAPEDSDFPDFRSCDKLRSWNKKPKLTYPQAYNERAIEGWAVLGFDIAADGTVGNVRVLSAQPSEEFGEVGAAVLRSGRFEAGDAAVTQCVERVRFVTPKDAAATSDS